MPMSPDSGPVAIVATDAPPRARPSGYPPPFAKSMEGRTKRPLGDPFGLTNFGVNIVHLKPGARSALRHAHTRQDEFIYVVDGEPTLVTNAGSTRLKPGMCAGFKAGTGDAHHLVNQSERDVVYLEIGDRTAGDEVDYPEDDIRVRTGPDGKQRYERKDGTPY
jgi:uncharacterized cupin superfamily protein